jgi:prepilin-type N-terminal cleavage/methylation domain-containing protein
VSVGLLYRQSTAQRGLSLIEMSIVLVIAAVLGGAALAVLNAQMANARISSARAALEVARHALVGYAAAQIGGGATLPYADDAVAGQPCNASGANIDDGSADNNCTSGNVPWVTLGIAQATMTDGWGGFVSYSVDNNVANNGLRRNAPAPNTTVFTLRVTVTDEVVGNNDDMVLTMSAAQLRGILIGGGVTLP